MVMKVWMQSKIAYSSNQADVSLNNTQRQLFVIILRVAQELGGRDALSSAVENEAARASVGPVVFRADESGSARSHGHKLGLGRFSCHQGHHYYITW